MDGATDYMVASGSFLAASPHLQARWTGVDRVPAAGAPRCSLRAMPADHDAGSGCDEGARRRAAHPEGRRQGRPGRHELRWAVSPRVGARGGVRGEVSAMPYAGARCARPARDDAHGAHAARGTVAWDASMATEVIRTDLRATLRPGSGGYLLCGCGSRCGSSRLGRRPWSSSLTAGMGALRCGCHARSRVIRSTASCAGQATSSLQPAGAASRRPAAP